MLNHSIRRFRQKRGLTQETLSQQAKIALPTLTKLESGVNANPTLRTLRRLSRALKVSLQELLK